MKPSIKELRWTLSNISLPVFHGISQYNIVGVIKSQNQRGSKSFADNLTSCLLTRSPGFLARGIRDF
jgi:hypothetical protein